MAAIDHTVIVFKNGKWMKEPYSFDENDEYINHCPFKYGRDGNIHTVNGEEIWDEIKWHYRDEEHAFYTRAGGTGKGVGLLWRLKWWFHVMEFQYYEKEIGEWKKDSEELYIYHDPLDQCYVSFYKNETDTYIVLGGYGHNCNVYAHFMNRGYGDEFEEKMAYEAYEWCIDDILEEVADAVFDGFWESENGRKALQKVFGVGLEDGFLKNMVFLE